MKDKTLVRNILTAVFPEECQAVGPNSLNDLLSEDVTLVPPEEGRPFPLMELFVFVKDVAQFIAAAYAVYELLKGKFGRKPTISEFKEEIAKQSWKGGPLSDEQVEQIIKEIRKRD